MLYKELAIILLEFPKPILMVKHVNWCSELPLPVLTSPSAAKEYFLREFKDVLVFKEDFKEAPLKLEYMTRQGIIEPAATRHLTGATHWS